MRRTSGRSLGTLLRFDIHFIPELFTCSPSLFSLLPLSPTPLPVLTPLQVLARSPQDMFCYTFTSKCTMCPYTFSLKLKLSCDISKERSIWSVKLCQVLMFCRYAILCTLTCWTRNYFFSFSTPVYKMRIIQEPTTIELWNKLNFEENKTEIIHNV